MGNYFRYMVRRAEITAAKMQLIIVGRDQEMINAGEEDACPGFRFLQI